MPIYEYQCLKCHEEFSLRRNMKDPDDEIKCQKCGAEKPKRLISGFSTGTVSCGNESKSFSGGG